MKTNKAKKQVPIAQQVIPAKLHVVRKGSKGKSNRSLILELIDLMLVDAECVSLYKVKIYAQKLLGINIRQDYIASQLLCKSYVLDCKRQEVYKADKF